MKTTRFVINLLTLCIMVVGMITLHGVNTKILSTTVDLLVIRDNISFYNEQPRKTDAMTTEAEDWFEERQEIYESEDFVIRTFSNQNTLVKLIIILMTLASYPVMIFIFLVNVARMIPAKKRKNRYHHREYRTRQYSSSI